MERTCFIWSRSKTLREKALSLEGYVNFFDENDPIPLQLEELKKKDKFKFKMM